MENNLKKSGTAEHPGSQGWRGKIHEIIFEADTPAGKLYDLVLIAAICASVLCVMFNSVSEFGTKYATFFNLSEWFFTIIFTIEYILRIICIRKPMKYILSFYGIIDLLSILPTFIGPLFTHSTRYLTVIRSLRMLRIFRVLKLTQFLKEATMLTKALHASRRKIAVFAFAVVMLVTILGSVMYIIEGGASHSTFTSIPKSIYWAVVTLTTVGYGDMAPQHPLGQAIASIVMLLGYAMIAVPTGIISVEVAKTMDSTPSTQCCPSCAAEGHDLNAEFCKFCGVKLN